LRLKLQEKKAANKKEEKLSHLAEFTFLFDELPLLPALFI
jgi:hypothetical protein